jgi:hypothetical protein
VHLPVTGFTEDDEIIEIVVRRIPVDVVDIKRRIRTTAETDRIFVFETPSSVCRGHIG